VLDTGCSVAVVVEVPPLLLVDDDPPPTVVVLPELLQSAVVVEMLNVVASVQIRVSTIVCLHH
jgi:hypothetical protein